MTQPAEIILKRGKEESLLRFHPWVFSGAIESVVGEPDEGDLVRVYDSRHQFIALGHCQVGAIAVRVLSFRDEAIDDSWWSRRLQQAYALRQALGLGDSAETTCYRLIHGEGDSLPGLVVDIYGTTAVMQAHSVGMYNSREAIVRAIRALYGDRIRAIFDKSSGTLPHNAGIDAVDGYLYGTSSDEPVMENGNRFHVNWERGPKTGFFIDQRENRALVGRYASGRRVLNTFSYTGGVSVYALQGGAASVDSVDSSQRAVELARENVTLNFGAQAPHRAIASDTFEFLKGVDNGAYNLIILDPPAFAKHHKVLGNALKGYQRLNAQAMMKIAPGGILFTFSCSQAVTREHFRQAVFSAAAVAGRNVRILHQLTQPADHPINIFHPEGEYLKGLVLYVG
jgi:23S rRNA (cytosine1962-C5)-methyltransferase